MGSWINANTERKYEAGTRDTRNARYEEGAFTGGPESRAQDGSAFVEANQFGNDCKWSSLRRRRSPAGCDCDQRTYCAVGLAPSRASVLAPLRSMRGAITELENDGLRSGAIERCAGAQVAMPFRIVDRSNASHVYTSNPPSKQGATRRWSWFSHASTASGNCHSAAFGKWLSNLRLALGAVVLVRAISRTAPNRVGLTLSCRSTPRPSAANP